MQRTKILILNVSKEFHQNVMVCVYVYDKYSCHTTKLKSGFQNIDIHKTKKDHLWFMIQ